MYPMPFLEINLVPSVNVESTPADNPTGISESNFIRWKGNLPEKRGGSALYINQNLDGIPNAIQSWGDLDGKGYVGIATNEQVYAYSTVNSSNTIISPQLIKRSSVTPVISTTAGTSDVVVTDPSVPRVSSYDNVTFDTPYYIGGLLLNGTYPITSGGGVQTYVINVSPQIATTTTTQATGLVPQFITSTGSSEIVVDFPLEYQTGTLAVGDKIGFIIPTSVGGLTILGQYIVSRVINSNRFVFVDDEAATSSANAFMNNGKLALRYWITIGQTLVGSGYGTNQYGQYGYGNGSNDAPITGSNYKADNWWLDARGSALIASAVGGPIFFYNTNFGFKNLSILNNAPIASNGSFVSMPYGHVMAWGASDLINPVQQPLYIKWSSATDPNNWSLKGNSDAGFYNVPTGSKIVRGIQGQTQQYWFTDVDLYAAQYIGYPGTYGFNKIGNGCGLVAPRGVGLLAGSLYWMSQRQFFVCPQGGSPTPIPCSVWDFIFQNIDMKYIDKVVCGTNSLFNEVSWFFPTMGQGTSPDPESPYNGLATAYVCYNAQYQEWDVGYMNRTAWFDQSLVGEPLSADSAGYVYQQDTTYNQSIGPLTFPINAWLQTGYFSIAQGQELSFVDWFLPDFKWGEYDQPQDADLSITFYVTDYAGQDPRVYGPYAFNKQTKFINPRFRGRFVSMKIESNDINSFWRLGSCRYRLAPSGRR
jgi:hypothetical protein